MENRALIVIADKNQYGLSHKLIAPTIKLLYIKRGFKCQVVNLHADEFDAALIDTAPVSAMARSYKHLIKTADHIHFITSIHLGGLSPALEGFLEQALTIGFAFDYDGSKTTGRLRKKRAFFHLQHTNNVKSKFNSAYLRIKFSILQRIFKDITITQSDNSWIDRDKKTKGINKLRNSLIKKLF
jgi:putative NADPH-quinone reductase|tara:strand:- start:743 stop:1294 length:552 start_codon:yes stop_codon:yes gene_type:complete